MAAVHCAVCTLGCRRLLWLRLACVVANLIPMWVPLCVGCSMLAPADKARWEAEQEAAKKKEQQQREAEAEAAAAKVAYQHAAQVLRPLLWQLRWQPYSVFCVSNN